MLRTFWIVLIFLFLPVSGSGHHSRAEFSGGIKTIEGELTRVIWRNPHPTLILQSQDENNAEQTWRIQVLANVNGMNRSGVTGERFQLGRQVRITGHLSSHRPGLLLATQAEFNVGNIIRLAPDESTGVAVYRDVGQAGNAILNAIDSTPSLFRVWTVRERVRNNDMPLRDHARAIKAAWDPIHDDVQRNCSALGMPGAMMSPHPIEFIQQQDQIVLKLEEWDGVRIINMDNHTTGATAASPMGYSIGQWEGADLLVTTKQINYPFLDEYGTPQSEAVEINERFKLSEDGRYLDWSAEVIDAETFTEPFVVSTTRWEWIPGEQLQSYNCEKMDDLLNPD
jgi:hypothetical protein